VSNLNKEVLEMRLIMIIISYHCRILNPRDEFTIILRMFSPFRMSVDIRNISPYIHLSHLLWLELRDGSIEWRMQVPQ
jgi:hypothetical protein